MPLKRESERGAALTETERAWARRPPPVDAPASPGPSPDTTVGADTMASMIAALTLGRTLKEAKASGLVTTPAEEAVWAVLAAQVAAAAGEVETPAEWFG